MLTEKQQRFADFYCAEPNATKAAEAAGYSPRTAYSQGQRLLKNVEVKKYIRDQLEVAADERILSVTRARAALSDIAMSPSVKDGIRVRALATLIKVAGTNAPMPPAEMTEPPTAEADGFAKIYLPLNGQDDIAVTAVQLPDGSIVPLAGHENDDLLIYQPLKEQESCEWRADDAD